MFGVVHSLPRHALRIRMHPNTIATTPESVATIHADSWKYGPHVSTVPAIALPMLVAVVTAPAVSIVLFCVIVLCYAYFNA
jgi:hypothetical protein